MSDQVVELVGGPFCGQFRTVGGDWRNVVIPEIRQTNFVGVLNAYEKNAAHRYSIDHRSGLAFYCGAKKVTT